MTFHHESSKSITSNGLRQPFLFLLPRGAKLLQHIRGLSVGGIETVSVLEHRQRCVVVAQHVERSSQQYHRTVELGTQRHRFLQRHARLSVPLQAEVSQAEVVPGLKGVRIEADRVFEWIERQAV